MKFQANVVWAIMVLFTAVFGNAQTFLVRYVSQGTDDAGTTPFNCSFATADNEIYFGECDSGEELVSGFRFTGFRFASPSEVSNACIEFWVDGTYTNPLHLRIYGEASDDAQTFSQVDKPSDRPLTTSYVDWVLTEEDVWQWNTKKRTPDVTPIVQEILGRPGWSKDNAIAFIFKNVEANSTHRRVYAIEREGMQKAAKLIVNENMDVTEPYDIYQRVLLINFDPLIPSHGNAPLHEVMEWNDPLLLSEQYAADMEEASHTIVDYEISKVVQGNYFPVKESGYRFGDGDEETVGSFLYSWEYDDWTDTTMVDYHAIARDYDMARKVDFGEVDEFWVFGGPHFGFYESRMAGKGAYRCNSPPLARVACARIFVQMGFNYERDVGLMVHDNGHRTEAIMTFVYGDWTNDSTHAWNRFTLYDQIRPDGAACGTVHFAPNSDSPYDYNNLRYVWSTHNDWLNNYPNLTGEKEFVNAAAWGWEMRLYHKWWFERIPRMAGVSSEYGMTRLNNWWPYIYEFNRFPESGSTLAQGAYVGEKSTFFSARITLNEYDDWRPVANAQGRVVWHGFDGHDFEIYSALLDGREITQITNNDFDDEYPQINDAGDIAWQAFDGVDYEIFTADERGDNITQITDNDQNDWHVQLNNNGRLVWDFWDGADYEILSCDVDGSNPVQITDNDAGAAYPLDDVWPQINNNGRVVWMGYNGDHWHIFSANADGSNVVQISSADYDHQYPHINDLGQVVWFAYHSDVNAEIYAAPADGSANEHLLSDNDYEDWHPYINNEGTVVWMGHNGASWDVYSAPFDGSTVTNVSNGATDHIHPRIDDSGFIAWQGYDGRDWEIFAWTDGKVYQLSDNDFDDAAVQASNKRAVWHGKTGGLGGAEIFSSYASIPVGVELISFTARRVEDKVRLFWRTAAETNNLGFEIQRKNDEKEPFIKIGFVSGAGTSAASHSYSFTDSTYQSGRCFYRLKQIDVDGAYSYSPVVLVQATTPDHFALHRNYPNPFNSSTSIRYELPRETNLRLLIFDVNGRKIKTLYDGVQTAGWHRAVWDGVNDNGKEAASGAYIVVMTAPQVMKTQKVLLLR